MVDSLSYTIRGIEEGDKDSVLDIWREQLGHGYPEEDDLDEALDDDSETLCLVAVESGGDVIGFSIGVVLTVEKFHEKLGSESLPWESGEIVLLDTNCVRESYMGNGVGTALTEERLSRFSSRGFDRFTAFSWIRTGGVPDSSGVLESCGFEAVEEFEEYWYEDSVEEGFECPDCGNPCRCMARLYVRD